MYFLLLFLDYLGGSLPRGEKKLDFIYPSSESEFKSLTSTLIVSLVSNMLSTILFIHHLKQIKRYPKRERETMW
jgi:hypothetical protein